MGQTAIESDRTHVLPLGVRASDAGRRSRRRRLDRGRGRPPVPRRDERRLDGSDPGPRPTRHHRRRAGPGRDARLRPQRTPHQPGAGAARRGARRRRARGVHPRALHGERRRRERDGDPDRPQLSRRARRDRSVAGDLAGTGVPRPDDADAGADRSSRACTVRSVPTCRNTCTSLRARGASTRPARPPSRRSTGRWRRRVRRTSPRTSARRSAPPRSRATRRPFASGRGSRSGATATASSCASTRS